MYRPTQSIHGISISDYTLLHGGMISQSEKLIITDVEVCNGQIRCKISAEPSGAERNHEKQQSG